MEKNREECKLTEVKDKDVMLTVTHNIKVCLITWRRPLGEQTKPVLALCQEKNLYNSVITHRLD